jgi:hypothetical protein
VAASQFHGSPLDLHAHGTRVVVDLRDVAEDLGGHFCADRFGEVFAELGVFDLARKCLFDSECCSLVEFYLSISVSWRGEVRDRDRLLFNILSMAL